MFRCKACNKMLDDITIKIPNPFTGEEEDLCFRCRDRYKSEYNILVDKSYPHITLTDNISPYNSKYFYEYHY